MTKPDITPEYVERLIAREPLLMSLPPQETDVAKTLRAQAERIVELEKETRELALDCLTAHGQADDALCDAKTSRNTALREAAHECEQVAYSGKYPQDDQSELGCLRCRDNILARIEGDTND